MTVRTRFAPSPTGSLHVGGARTALYCLLFARNQGGSYLLRIEDTDQARSTEESRQSILRDLRWLGLLWDEGPEVGGDKGPYLQSQRLDLYRSYANKLLESGDAYKAYETREELGAMRAAATAAKRTFRYKRVPYSDADLARFEAEGRVPVLRFAAPDRSVTVIDEILGPVTQTSEEIEDIVILKTDGFPTYHFAVVVDDSLMGITHVMRGQEHLLNTHKHMGVIEALGFTPPTFGHLPTINNMAGPKMSKRDKAKAAREAGRNWGAQNGAAKGDYSALAQGIGIEADELKRFMKKKSDSVPLAEKLAAFTGIDLPMIEVMDFRIGGYLPEALNNFLALLGWSPGDDREFMTIDEMSEVFTLARVGKTSAKFDVQKLTWMNGEYIRRSTEDRLLQAIESRLEVTDSVLAGCDDDQRRALIRMYRERMNTLAELDRSAAFFFEAPTEYAPKAVKKHILKGGGLERLGVMRGVLAHIDDWSANGIETVLNAWAAENELGLGKVAQPLRVALSGAGVTPGIWETLAFLSKDEVLARIDRCVAALEAQ